MNQAYAQTTQPARPAGAQPSPFFNMMVPLLAIFIVFYFLILQPQNKEKQKREALLNSIQRGDRVLTRGGIYGIVADIKENILVLKISENNKVEVEKSYVETVHKPS